MGRDPREWTRREAKSYLNWILHILDERVDGLLRYFGETDAAPPEVLLDRMGKHIAMALPSDLFSHERDKTPIIIEKGGRQFAMPPPEGRALAAEGYALAMDMGLLMAKLLLARGSPEYRWDIGPKPKSDMSYNHPVLTRVDGQELNPLEPMGVSIANACAILRGTHGPDQWIIVFNYRQLSEMPDG